MSRVLENIEDGHTSVGETMEQHGFELALEEVGGDHDE